MFLVRRNYLRLYAWKSVSGKCAEVKKITADSELRNYSLRLLLRLIARKSNEAHPRLYFIGNGLFRWHKLLLKNIIFEIFEN